jgi:hypothetical protein
MSRLTWADVARLDAQIGRALEVSAYRTRGRAAKDGVPLPPAPPPPSPPPVPSFPTSHGQTVMMAAFVTASARRARGAEDDIPNDEQSDPRKRDDEPGNPPPPKQGDLILDAIKRREKK